jgi:hypothetical protein
MNPLGIAFPTPAQAALRDAEELGSLSARERLDCLLSLIRTVDTISRQRADRAAQIAEHDRMKDEELECLVRTQVRSHV